MEAFVDYLTTTTSKSHHQDAALASASVAARELSAIEAEVNHTPIESSVAEEATEPVSADSALSSSTVSPLSSSASSASATADDVASAPTLVSSVARRASRQELATAVKSPHSLLHVSRTIKFAPPSSDDDAQFRDALEDNDADSDANDGVGAAVEADVAVVAESGDATCEPVGTPASWVVPPTHAARHRVVLDATRVAITSAPLNISELTRLTHLVVRAAPLARLNAAAVIAFVAPLSTQLVTLELTGCGLTRFGDAHIAMPMLERLLLSRNALTVAPFAAAAPATTTTTTTTTDGGGAIGACVAPRLRTLDLSHNELKKLTPVRKNCFLFFSTCFKILQIY